jgi:hypothetical protein
MRNDKRVRSKTWLPFIKYGALIAFAVITACVVFVAMTK